MLKVDCPIMTSGKSPKTAAARRAAAEAWLVQIRLDLDAAIKESAYYEPGEQVTVGRETFEIVRVLDDDNLEYEIRMTDGTVATMAARYFE